MSKRVKTMKNSNNIKVDKFFIRKNTLAIVILAILVCVALYSISLYLLTLDIVQSDSNTLYKVTVVRDVAVILLSIFGGSLISILLIERKNRNCDYLDDLINEVILSKDFTKNMSPSNRELLERKLTDAENDQQWEILKGIKNKLFEKNPKYYFSQCTIDVICTFKENYIEKSITKDLRLKSYEKDYKLENFMLLQNTNTKINGLDNLEIEFVKINKEMLPDNALTIEETPVGKDEHVLLRNGYNTRRSFFYPQPIDLNNRKEVQVQMKYISRVDLSDHNYTSRISAHCRHYTLNFRISNNDKYKINGSAFGFMESAENTLNPQDANSLKFVFDDWIFQNDGISISFEKLNASPGL